MKKNHIFSAAIFMAMSLTFLSSCASSKPWDSSGKPKQAECMEYNNETHFCDNRDGKTYRYGKIGEQTWMLENLNYEAKNSKCYGNDPANCGKYGRLYDWATAMALPSSCNNNSCSSQANAKPQGICPSGWHVPGINDMSALADFVNTKEEASEASSFKAKTEWSDNSGSEDPFGFYALPGGSSNSFSGFNGVGEYGRWWSIKEKSSYDYDEEAKSFFKNVHIIIINLNGAALDGMPTDSKSSLLSVRCLKD